MPDYSRHQQKIIKNYYNNLDTILLERLSDLVTNLYLAEGKKQEKLWKTAGEVMEKIEVPPSRRKHLMDKKDPALLAELVKELSAK